MEPDYSQIFFLMSKTTVFLWLFLATIIDSIYPLINKSFFINTVDKIDGDQLALRGLSLQKKEPNENFFLIYVKKFYYFFMPGPDNTEEFSSKCPAFDQIYNCPLFKGLTTFIKNSKNNPKYADRNIKKVNDMWNIVRRSCIIRNRQVSFLEMLIVQVASIFLFRMTFTPDSDIMPNVIPFEIVFGILLLILFFALAISLIETKPSYFYEIKAIRLSIILICWGIFSWYLSVISSVH